MIFPKIWKGKGAKYRFHRFHLDFFGDFTQEGCNLGYKCVRRGALTFKGKV